MKQSRSSLVPSGGQLNNPFFTSSLRLNNKSQTAWPSSKVRLRSVHLKVLHSSLPADIWASLCKLKLLQLIVSMTKKKSFYETDTWSWFRQSGRIWRWEQIFGSTRLGLGVRPGPWGPPRRVWVEQNGDVAFLGLISGWRTAARRGLTGMACRPHTLTQGLVRI